MICLVVVSWFSVLCSLSGVFIVLVVSIVLLVLNSVCLVLGYFGMMVSENGCCLMLLVSV